MTLIFSIFQAPLLAKSWLCSCYRYFFVQTNTAILRYSTTWLSCTSSCLLSGGKRCLHNGGLWGWRTGIHHEKTPHKKWWN